MDFGGIRGQYLSDQVVQMYNEFMELTNTFQSRGDNPLDTTNTVSDHSNYLVCLISSIIMIIDTLEICG